MLKFTITLGLIISSLSLTTIEETVEPVSESIIREGSVTGNVTIPPIRTRQRISRGRAYRNRGNATSTTTSANTAELKKQALLNTIISAHPISFEAEVKPLPEPVQIIQRGAQFVPTVTAVTIGSTVEFVNDDPFFHNVFSLTSGARFNIGRRPKGDVYKQLIPATKWKVEGIGEVNLLCDIHAQMNAKIISLDTPYFTRANEDGTFSLEGLPDGTYDLRAYNPRFEVIHQQVVISGGVISVDLDF